MKNLKKLFDKKVDYKELNALQKENYNYCQAIGILANYGFECFLLSNDWNGADLIASKIEKEIYYDYKVQLKSRLTFSRKYLKKNLFIMFFDENRNLYIFPHDKVLETLCKKGIIKESKSWLEKGNYSFPRLSKQLIETLEEYKLNL
jgi:hypothetical protein